MPTPSQSSLRIVLALVLAVLAVALMPAGAAIASTPGDAPDAGTALSENDPPPVELDADADTVPDAIDNCAGTANPGQADADGDGQGDACDADDDNDGVDDGDDAFPTDPTRSAAPVTPTPTPTDTSSQSDQGAQVDSGGGSSDPAGDRSAPAITLPGSRARLKRALRRGVGVRTAIDEPSTVRVELRLPGAVAKRLRLSRGASVVVGRATATLAAGATATVVVKLSPRARRALRRLRGVQVGVLVTATDAAGNAALAARWLSLRR